MAPNSIFKQGNFPTLPRCVGKCKDIKTGKPKLLFKFCTSRLLKVIHIF